ncbi:MFS transporter [Shimazuella sp. AN120528]|uniref:MFS transporter n=1 Tax=Shimazuella soli TaxID=1892854 RepID=UPI001F0EE4A7|nr:MFS transporter [Shimazuella soli]MCH5585741.1 MFS transporter [Shimazuella soli]
MINSSTKKNNYIISSFFLMYFIALGAFAPLFSLYLQGLQFTGSQIGIIASINPLIVLFFQPLWGYAADLTKRFHLILIFTILLSAGLGLLFPMLSTFSLFLLLSICLAFLQAAIEPVSTSIILSYTEKFNLSFGNFRLWGAVGYGLSIWALGQLAQLYSLKIIFYTFSLFLALSAFYAWKLPYQPSQIKQSKPSLRQIKKLMTHKRFLLFLLACFLVYGTMLSNNSFYGLLYISLGGTISGLGVSFLISVGSEVPFMNLAGKLLKHINIATILLVASFVSGVQYLLFFYHSSTNFIYLVNIAQGFSLGIFIPVSLQYVQSLTSKSFQTTAVGIYSGVSLGLGNWFFTLIGGIVLEHSNIHYVYLLFGIVSLIGMLLFLVIRLLPQNADSILPYEG